jgi:hypothetical protein
MEPNDVVVLIWNIAGVVVTLSLSCIVAYVAGHGDGYKRGIEKGAIDALETVANEMKIVRRVMGYGRKDTHTKHKRRSR